MENKEIWLVDPTAKSWLDAARLGLRVLGAFSRIPSLVDLLPD